MSTITVAEAHERIAGVLRAHGVELSMSGCACCGSFEAKFPDGATCSDVEVGWFDTEDYKPK